MQRGLNRTALMVGLPIILALLFLINVNLPFSYSAPPETAGVKFAPRFAKYLVTQLDPDLTSEVLTTQLTTDLIASSSGSNLGSLIKPWHTVFAVFGKFTEVVSNILSASGTDQSIFINPSGSGRVIIGGDSLVVAPRPNDPATGQAGQIYFNTTLGEFRGFNGTSWQSLSFKSVDDRSIDLESNSSQHLSITNANQTGLKMSSSFTIELWVKLEMIPTGAMALAGKQNSNVGGDFGYLFLIQNNLGTMRLFTWLSPSAGNASPYTANWTPNADTWYHLAVVWDAPGKVLKYYVDGLQQGQDIATQESSLYTGGTAPFTIGADGNQSSEFFDGKIDEVRVWNKIRTTAEILNSKNVELTGTETNLQGYWKFNNNLSDSTNNNNHLTNNGSAIFSTDKPF